MTMTVKDTKSRKSGYSESLGVLYGLHSCRRLKENKKYCLFNIHVQLEKSFKFFFSCTFLLSVSGQIYVIQLSHGKFPRGQVVSVQVNHADNLKQLEPMFYRNLRFVCL